MNSHAHLSESLSDLFTGQFELLQEFRGHIEECLFGPPGEPVESAAVDERGEHSAADSEGVSYGRHAQTDVQVVSDSVDECLVDYLDRVHLLHLYHHWAHSVDDLVLVLGQPQVRDFTRVQQVVDVFYEGLRDYLGVCH